MSAVLRMWPSRHALGPRALASAALLAAAARRAQHSTLRTSAYVYPAGGQQGTTFEVDGRRAVPARTSTSASRLRPRRSAPRVGGVRRGP